eukprot:3603921-Rhodomonas_salina.3
MGCEEGAGRRRTGGGTSRAKPTTRVICVSGVSSGVILVPAMQIKLSRHAHADVRTTTHKRGFLVAGALQHM